MTGCLAARAGPSSTKKPWTRSSASWLASSGCSTRSWQAMLNELGQRKSLAQATEALEAVTFHRDALRVEAEAAIKQFSQLHAEADQKAQALQGEILQTRDSLAEAPAELAAVREAGQAELATAHSAYEAQFTRLQDDHRAEVTHVQAGAGQVLQMEHAALQVTRQLLQGEIAKLDILSQQINEVREQLRQTDAASRNDRAARREAEGQAAAQAAKVEILTQQMNAALAWEPVALNAQATAAALAAHIENLNVDRQAILASTSWQLTWPLRAAMRRSRQ